MREVKMIKDLVVYHDGFTRSFYARDTVQSFEEGYANILIGRGYCCETKPLLVKKETKPLMVKHAVKGHNTSSN
jgi:hypothetical protein